MRPTGMAAFPPNLEDGELWLPSDVFLEIATTTNTAHQLPSAAAKPSPFPPPKKKVCDSSFFAANPNVKTTIGNRFPAVDYGRQHKHNIYQFRNPTKGFFQLEPRPFPKQHPALPIQGFRAMVFLGKSEGTGVFFPKSNNDNSTSSKEIFGPAKGTGVFLNHQETVKPKKEEGKKTKGAEKKCSVKDQETKRNTEVSQLPPEICLPQEWSYD